MVQKWSSERIVEKLYQLHLSGTILIGDHLPSDVHNALYYKRPTGKMAYFDSLEDAREATAQRFESESNTEAAQKIRELNGPRESPRKFREEQWKQRREDLVQKLRSKLEGNEDLGYRAQQASDRTFVNACVTAFGQYKRVFEAAKIDYSKYGGPEKRDKRYYFGELLSLISGRSALDRPAVESRDRKLVERLDDYFGGYYRSLEVASRLLRRQAKTRESKRANPDYWKRKRNEKKGRTKKREREENLQRIIVVRPEETFSGEIPDLEIDKLLTGKEIYKRAKESEDWLTTPEFAKRLGCTASNITGNLLPNLKGAIIRYEEGDRSRYLFHATAIREYQRRSTREVPRNSIGKLALDLGVSYSKVRFIIDNLGLDPQVRENGTHRVLTPREEKVVREVIDREKRILRQAKASIDKKASYTFHELEVLGVPTTHLKQTVSLGDIEPVMESGNAREVRGKDVLAYLTRYGNRLRTSQTLRLITHFQPHLNTTTELVQQTGLPRTTLLYRLNKLLEENPQAAFRIRKSSQRSIVISNSGLVPILINWNNRHEFQLVEALRAEPERVKPREVAKASTALEELLKKDGTIAGSLAIETAEYLEILRNYEREKILIGDLNVSSRDLLLIYRYMTRFGYTTLELRDPFSPDEVKNMLGLQEVQEIIEDPNSLQHVMTLVSSVEFGLYQGNIPLIRRVMRDRGILSEAAFDVGRDALLTAARKFRPLGYQFSTFAYTVISNAIGNLLARRREQSLDENMGDGNRAVKYFIEDTSSPEKQGRYEKIQKGVASLLEELDERERTIVTQLFGIDSPKKKLRDIAADLGISEVTAAKIRDKGLEKLRNNPDAKLLIKSMEDS